MENPLPHRLRQLRETKGWTLKETEEKSSVPLSYLSAIENGRRQAGKETLKKLAAAFGETTDEADKLLKEFEQCQHPEYSMEVVWSPFATIVNGTLVHQDPTQVTSFDIAQEVEQLLLVLGGCRPQQIIHQVVARTDREISKDGNRLSRGYVVKHDDAEFLIEVAVRRNKPA